MKKIILNLCILLVLILIACFITCQITTAKIIQAIEVDGVNEVDNGIVTLKIDGKFYDYKYEYNENFKTLQEQINREFINEWANNIK